MVGLSGWVKCAVVGLSGAPLSTALYLLQLLEEKEGAIEQVDPGPPSIACLPYLASIDIDVARLDCYVLTKTILYLKYVALMRHCQTFIPI